MNEFIYLNFLACFLIIRNAYSDIVRDFKWRLIFVEIFSYINWSQYKHSVHFSTVSYSILIFITSTNIWASSTKIYNLWRNPLSGLDSKLQQAYAQNLCTMSVQVTSRRYRKYGQENYYGE